MNKKVIAFVALVLAVVVTGYSVSGTYAKYTDTFTGKTATAHVAKWSFNVNETAAEEEFTFDLFNEENTSLTAEGKAAQEDLKDIILIAPGSSGTETIEVENNSDVKALLSLKFDTTGSTATGIPLKYTVKIGNTTLSETGDLDNIDFSSAAAELKLDNGENLTITIDWKWTDDTNGETDTPIGKNSATSDKRTKVIVNAKLTATQDEIPSI